MAYFLYFCMIQISSFLFFYGICWQPELMMVFHLYSTIYPKNILQIIQESLNSAQKHEQLLGRNGSYLTLHSNATQQFSPSAYSIEKCQEIFNDEGVRKYFSSQRWHWHKHISHWHTGGEIVASVLTQSFSRGILPSTTNACSTQCSLGIPSKPDRSWPRFSCEMRTDHF